MSLGCMHIMLNCFQGSKAQDELHKERAGYFDKKLTVYKEHYAKIEKLEFTKTEFLVKREESAVEHQERLHIMKAGFAVQTQKVHIARGLDRVETNFVDAVNNIRGGDDGLRSAVGSFSRLETCLTNGLPLERAVNQALVSSSNSMCSANFHFPRLLKPELLLLWQCCMITLQQSLIRKKTKLRML